ncbi:MAG: hypothetical protein V4664_02325 [Patescibacteria group bacterium]
MKKTLPRFLLGGLFLFCATGCSSSPAHIKKVTATIPESQPCIFGSSVEQLVEQTGSSSYQEFREKYGSGDPTDK